MNYDDVLMRTEQYIDMHDKTVDLPSDEPIHAEDSRDCCMITTATKLLQKCSIWEDF